MERADAFFIKLPANTSSGRRAPLTIASFSGNLTPVIHFDRLGCVASSPSVLDGQNIIFHPMLDKAKKLRIIKKFRTHDNNTGSPQVQIALLTEEIKDLTAHLKTHRKDNSSRNGLFKKLSERRKLMKYLEREDAKAYAKLIDTLGLKRIVLEEEPAIDMSKVLDAEPEEEEETE